MAMMDLSKVTKTYRKANEQHIAGTDIYVKDGVAYLDQARTTKIKSFQDMRLDEISRLRIHDPDANGQETSNFYAVPICFGSGPNSTLSGTVKYGIWYYWVTYNSTKSAYEATLKFVMTEN